MDLPRDCGVVEMDRHERPAVVHGQCTLGHDLAVQLREELAGLIVGADVGVHGVGAAWERLASDARPKVEVGIEHHGDAGVVA